MLACRIPEKEKKIAGVVLFNTNTSNTLILQRTTGEWDLPKGHVEKKEKVSKAAERECWEETGLHVELCNNTRITLPSRSMLYFYPAFYGGSETDVLLSSEHIYYKWVSPLDVKHFFEKNDDFTKIVLAIYRLL